MTRPSAPVVDIWRSDLPGGDFGWQCHTCKREQGGFLGWGTAEAGARDHERQGCDRAGSDKAVADDGRSVGDQS